MTVISIAIGVASVILTSSIGTFGRETISEEMSRLGMGGMMVSRNPNRKDLPLAEDQLELVRKQQGVVQATPVMTSYTQIKMRNFISKTFVWGIDEGTSQVVSMEILYGRLIHKGDVNGRQRVCVIDRNTAYSFYKRDNIVGKDIDLLVDGRYEKFTVVGIVNSGGPVFQSIISSYAPGFVYIPYTTMQDIAGKQNFDQIAVTIDEEKEIGTIESNVLQTLITSAKQMGEEISKESYTIENMAQHKDQLDTITQIIGVVVSAIAGISLVVSGLGVMTIMLISVKERTREIGIKKSVGATCGMIMREFMIEAVMLSLCGSLFGTFAGMIIVMLGGNIFQTSISIPISTVAFCIILTLFLGVIFGAYPSYKASRLLPVAALRLE